ncbi:MAG TPA: hypothetical protein VI731_06440, partial [Bacteroidia bacterium]|nr:hypothetical protein [Bacteroidia bacterium]
MQRKTRSWLLAALLFFTVIFAWRYFGTGFSVETFRPFSNFKARDKTLALDLTDAVYRGIEIPTVKQLPGGKFIFTFKAKNRNLAGQKLFYKIYYQNESYKFQEFIAEKKFKYENPLCTRNFYGSWGETDNGFHSTGELSWNEEISVTDSFRIVGNPRNEEIYFGRDDRSGISARAIANMVNYIRSREDWVQAMGLKARENGVTLDQQIYRDAVWQIDDARKFAQTNNRWKRNPRTGKYKFMLVVTTEAGFKNLPPSVQNVTRREHDGSFINPFYYFLHGMGSVDKGTQTLLSDEALTVVAKFSPGNGVYVDPFEFIQAGNDTAAYCATCGTDSLLY